MSFRLRLTLLASLAVAVALVGASVVVYYSYRHDLISQVDSELASSLTMDPLRQIVTLESNGQAVVGVNGRRSTFKMYLPGSSTTLLVHMARGAPAALPEYVHPQTVAGGGAPRRQLTVSAGSSVITVSLPLAEVNRSLARLRWLLVLTCLGGVGAAALLGTLVSGRAIAPLRRLTEATERIAETGELSARTGVPGRDEIARLSARLDQLLATLEASLRSQRRLVADASHELRTPLAALRVNVGLLATSNDLDPGEREELVADVQEELESMTAVVGELIELAQGEEVDVAPTEFRLDEIVRVAVDRAAKRSPGIEFRTEMQPTNTFGVPERVERAVDNLVDNARKWSPAGSAVDISVRDGVVEVRDRGPGIAAEDRPFVFDRFYRSIDARGKPGAGLGLAIVKQVAEAHNGTVTVEQPPGGGTLLRLALPNR